VYYHETGRAQLRASYLGQLLRTWFPITRFKDAGKTRKGRTDANQAWYENATVLVKIFFLWAKYFLGFYMNFLVYLNQVTTERNWKFLHGMYLLNAGTVSLAMFLHTMRFKKVLPPRFAFSVYLVQIYLTFTAIPLAYEMFASHWKLCALCLGGLFCNMTRNRGIHALWCAFAMLLMCRRDYLEYLGEPLEW